MSSHTPLFDAALDKILNGLVPHTRTCAETGEEFEIGEKEIEICKMHRVPPPTTVGWARTRIKRAFLGGVDLFRRTLPDGRSVVAMYDPESPATILPLLEWQSDAFDGLAFGASVQPNQPFFEQWPAFSTRVPRPAMIQGPSNENSEWALDGLYQKNCYFTYGGTQNEDLLYSDICISCKRSSDLTLCSDCDTCVDLVDCTNCTHVLFSERCERCFESLFCLECKDCSNCFGCTNLRYKQYYFFNEPLSKEEYTKRLATINLADAEKLERWRQKVQTEIWDQSPRPADHQHHCEDCVGDGLRDSHQTSGVLVFDSERAYNTVFALHCTDVWNLTSDVYSQNCVSCVTTNNSSGCVCTIGCLECLDVEYSEFCTSCEHCFGCIGLRHKKFCLFNKQYTEEEYWKLVDALKTVMLSRGEYGEFFPYRTSLFAYNTSHTESLFPLTKGDATKLGGRWYGFAQEKALPATAIEELPLRLADTTKEQLTQKYRCPITERPFGFVAPEIEMRRALGIALPRLHPTARRMARMAHYFPFQFHRAACAQCKKEIITRVPSNLSSRLLCETCYSEWVTNEK